MKPSEYRRQIFRGSSQWEHGLTLRLRSLDGGGVALFSRPAFSGWATRDDAALGAGSLAVDDCGRLFWIHERSCRLYRRDPVNDLIEPVAELAECGDEHPRRFGRMLFSAGRLWVLDYTASRIIAMRPDTFQTVAELPLRGALDMAIDGERLFTVDAGGIRIFDLHGRLLGGPNRERLSRPVGLGVGSGAGRQWIYALDWDARGLLRYSAIDGTFDGQLGSFDDVRAGFRPWLIVVGPDGRLIVSDGAPVAHEFAPDGGYVGEIGATSPVSAVQGLAVDAAGELWAGSPDGIARFGTDSGAAGSSGLFYTRTLDNGSDRNEGWHRVDLSAELDAGGALGVSYATTNDAALAVAVTGILDRNTSAADKARAIESVLGDLWRGPEELRAVPPPGAATAALTGFPRGMSHSVFFRRGTGRFLWLKLQLSGLAPGAKASVREMRLYYPRLSYLRYLPAVYQHDPVSEEFLERFLSMFETVFDGIEATIDRIPEMFDPALAPGEFLDWLAQWLDLVTEEDWPAGVKRRLLQNAARLYERKGTPGGLAEFIEVVTGTRPVIRESFETERPLVLGGGILLGFDSRVQRRPATAVGRNQRTVLGCSARLGATEIRATTHVPADPFRAAAHRFTVMLDLPPHRFRRYERGLHRIIRENAPAHASYDIRLVSGAGLGPRTVLGVNFAVADPRPMLLGYSALGASVCARRIRYGPEVGVDATVTAPAPASRRAPALTDGER